MAVTTEVKPKRVAYEVIDGVRYPWAEEKSVVQGDWHLWTVNEGIGMVQALLRDRPAARVFSDIFLFWEQGNPHKRLAPDLLVLPEVDAPERGRKSVKLWQERSRPAFVLEVLSEETLHEDLGKKWDIYQDEIGVPEYFVCDPLTPVRVRGYRLVQGTYQAIDADEEGRVWSEQLQAWLGTGSRGRLRVWSREGAEVPTDAEARERVGAETRRADEEARRAEEEARRAEAAEARIRELEEQLRRRPAEPGSQCVTDSVAR